MDHTPSRNPLEASEYAKLTGFDGKWRETWWRKDFLQLIAKRGGFENAEKILDVGCGAGHWGRTLTQALQADVKISGVDIEANFVDRAIALGNAFGLKNTDYKIGDAAFTPFADGSFDLVTCQTVLIHVKNPQSVLADMMRVLKPGGTLLLAEPNNVVGYLSLLLTEPQPEWTTVQSLLNFYHTCVQGKIALGMGDSTIGSRLPNLVTAAGFTNVHVAINENCPALIPPYTDGTQPIEYDFVKSCLDSDAWLGFGPRDNAKRFFDFGGGKPAQFEKLWETAMSVQKDMLAALENKTYSGSRGSMMYLVIANKAAFSR